jgi:hypothetical protein
MSTKRRRFNLEIASNGLRERHKPIDIRIFDPEEFSRALSEK